MRRRFRTLNRLYAFLWGYFWLPCPKCGQMFGGHERGTTGVPTGTPGEEWMACWRHG
jgi:hypothetical protein